MPATPRVLLTLAAIAALAGCDQARQARDPGQASGASRCTRCHGDQDRIASELLRAAPPASVAGATAVTDRGVGAHQAHLNGKAVSLGVACHECHAEPGARHPTGAVEFAFSTAGNMAPRTAWDKASLTCATSYCHDPLGAGLKSPAWISTGGAACGSCHALPPSKETGHPEVSSALTGCAACHPATMKPDGTLDVAGGKHVNGKVDALGHGDYTSPAVHGPKALDFLGGISGAQDCAACHGADLGGGFGPSCTACHATNGWTGWRTNCSFCHGARNATVKAGYDVAAHPTWAAPPDGVAQRLGAAADPARIGAHQVHLSDGSLTKAFACSTCHAVPADTGHLRGAAARANVVLSGSGQRSLPASLGTYDQASGTCATSCHGPTGSPAWSSTGSAACGTCHALPPATSTGHPAVTGGPTACALCHPQTVKPDGTIDVAGGAHVNGKVEVTTHGDYTSPAVHGPKALDFLGGTAGALQCTSCHGSDFGGGFGPSCNACHTAVGWTGWRTNCSFCHGQATAAAKAGYALAAHPTWSAPPDDVAQRLGAASSPARTGAHQAHLTGTTSGGLAFAQPFGCATCHAVPADIQHVRGSTARAAVALAGAGQAKLPASLGSYDQASGTCTTYCHGASPSPAWSATGLACGACHALPPATSTGHPAVGGTGTARCAGCHPDTVNADGSINAAGGKHLNGTVDGGGHSDYSAPATHGPLFFAFLRGATDALHCNTCHGADYGGAGGPSCTACHAAVGWTGWRTNCSFCHGARTAASKAGYNVIANPGWSAPPDALAQRLGGAADPSRTGAHQAHLAGLSGGNVVSAPIECVACHPVPADEAHAGGPGRAILALKGTGSLPASLGSYDRTAGTCATYCHGSTLSGGTATTPPWTGGPVGCASCHGYPPATGQHDFHINTVGAWCADCHAATVSFPAGVGDPGQALPSHVDGKVEVQFFTPGTTWDGANCTSACHGGDTYSWQ